MLFSEDHLFTKIVSEKEFIFTVLASNEGISPKLVSWKRENGKYTIKSEKYEGMLMDQPKYIIYKEDGAKLIRKLHSIGIFHADITEENFVVNSGEIKLIDFGCSQWIEDLTEKNFNNYMNPASSVSDLLEIEVKEFEWICDQRK